MESHARAYLHTITQSYMVHSKMKPLRLLLPLLITFETLVSACSSIPPVVSQKEGILPTETQTSTATPYPRDEVLPTNLATSENVPSQVILYDEEPLNGFPNDAASIDAITFFGNSLKINITYQGGCQEHTFALYTFSAFLQSYPQQAQIYLSHDSGRDTCTEKIEKLLTFDLTPLNQERTDPSDYPLLLRVMEPIGGSFATEPYMPLIEWP